MNEPDFQSVWIDRNTAQINAERRRSLLRAALWVTAIIAGALLFSAIFWSALAAATATATAAPAMMRF
jgi:hypothetical protein